MKKPIKVILMTIGILVLLCILFFAFLAFYRTTNRTISDFDYLTEGESTMEDMSMLHTIYPARIYGWGCIFEYPTAEGQYIHVKIRGDVVESISIDDWSLLTQ